jgi:hypothetical protein
MRWIVPGLTIVLLAAAAASGSGTGISGRVTSSPTCPVERYPPDPQCAPRGFRARVRITRVADGKVVARLTTGSDGRFRIALRTGRYRVLARPANGASLPRCPGARAARVSRSGYTRVAIGCDSGIR